MVVIEGAVEFDLTSFTKLFPHPHLVTELAFHHVKGAISLEVVHFFPQIGVVSVVYVDEVESRRSIVCRAPPPLSDILRSSLKYCSPQVAEARKNVAEQLIAVLDAVPRLRALYINGYDVLLTHARGDIAADLLAALLPADGGYDVLRRAIYNDIVQNKYPGLN